MSPYQDFYDDYDEDPFEEIRGALAPEYQDLPAEEVADLFLEAGMSPEQAEGFLKSLGKIAQTALPVVGTAVGTAFGGPVGGMVGGALGGVAGKAIGGATRDRPRHRRQPRRPRSPRRRRMRARRRRPRRVRRQPVAAAQLQQFLSNPKVIQALMAMALGREGARTMQVGSGRLPVAAVANTVSYLAQEAAAAYNAEMPYSTESVPGYLLDESGEFLADPLDAAERAELVLAYFEEEAWQRADEWQEQVADRAAFAREAYREDIWEEDDEAFFGDDDDEAGYEDDLVAEAEWEDDEWEGEAWEEAEWEDEAEWGEADPADVYAQVADDDELDDLFGAYEELLDEDEDAIYEAL